MPSNDPLGAVFPGDEPPNSARGWNAYNAAARRTRQNVLGNAPGGEPLLLPAEPANLVFVQAGGDGVEPWTVSRYGDTPIDLAEDEDTGRRRPVYADGTPTNSTDPVVITVEAAGAGENARAVCAGVARCRVNVTSTSHAFAVPIAGDRTKLVSDDTSGYPIVAREGGTGTQWAQVLLGAGAGAAANLTRCRDRLAGLDPATDRITFQIIPGSVSGLCAEIEAQTLVGYAPDPEVERWVSVGTFPTKLGDTSLTYQYDDATGDPVVTLTGTTGEGSGATTVIQPLKYVRCVNGCEEYAARPLLWCDSAPVTDCEDCPDGTPRRWRFTLAGGTGDFAAANGEWTVVRTTGCEWTATRGGFTAKVFTFGGGLSVLRVANGDESVSVQWVTDLTCCDAWTPALDDISAGEGSTPPDPPTVTPLGPCVTEPCADNTFRVRVCCGARDPYDWCGTDGAPQVCLFIPAGTLLGSPPLTCADIYRGPAAAGMIGFYVGAELRYFCTYVFQFADYVPVGFGLFVPTLPPECTGDPGTQDPYQLSLARAQLRVFYDPEAAGGLGRWRYCWLDTVYGTTFCSPGDVLTDPAPGDDPFVLRLPGGVTLTGATSCPAAPPPPPPPPPVSYDCVDGACVETEGGPYVDDPTCGGDCDPPPPGSCCDGAGEPLEPVAGVRPPLKVIIPDGARAGEYTLTDNLANFWDYIQTDPLMRLSVSCDAGTWYLFCSPCGTGACVATASSASCSPFGLIFPGADFGATGDITVELA